MVNPYTPGGSVDLACRPVAAALAEIWGEQVIVDNRPGAGTIIGTEIVVRAEPDGYTVLCTSSTIAIIQSMYRDIRFDPLRDLSPVILIASSPSILVVHPGLAAQSVNDLIALAKARPGQIAAASSGVGTTTHLTLEMFKTMAQIDLLHVPYKGGAPAISDLIGGQVKVFFNTPGTLLPHVMSGRLRALAVTSAKRTEYAPELPTIAITAELTVSSAAPAAEPLAAVALADVAAAAEPPAAVAPERRGWLSKLQGGLSKTRSNLAGMFGLLKIDEALYEELETALLVSDTGAVACQRVLSQLRNAVNQQRLTNGAQVKRALRTILADQLKILEAPIDIDQAAPLVMMIAGVNGAGKTTSIGKLTHHLQREGKSILLAAGDTFRAAAREQLAAWGERNNVQVVAQHGGDPGAVAFDAVTAGIARSTGVVLIDTAGRLPTQTNLMEELKKIKRSIAKAMPDAPHQCVLVLDGNTGQNMLTQVKAFDDAIGLTGLIVTKLDGTAKAGALVGLAEMRRSAPIPVYFIGVGEGIDDLQAFSANEFVNAMLGD